MKKEFDAFISHASEDKRYFIRPLAQKIQEYGAKIWYDEFSLKPGVSLSRSIEQGLSNSKFGLVVLSKAFFKKNWTTYELSALNSFELINPGIIIPIWYKVNLEQVREFSPYLSDKLAIVFDRKSIDEVALEILETIREDLFSDILTKKAWKEILKKGESKIMTVDDTKGIKSGPIRHETLPIGLLSRIRMIRSILLEVHPHSFDYWVEGFQRDLRPEDEVLVWEKISSCYLESVTVLKLSTQKTKFDAFATVFTALNGIPIKDNKVKILPEAEQKIIYEICRYPMPVFDIQDKPFDDQI